ncbi:trans-sulfuration enzyme family protein [Herbidospora galbida]|uniref:trans-sulfuration enzyme family protein n=1 Tax=Herbidospora galbida TaxID=2575442 RepID=UPI001FE743C3|nr:aminotransferase class I/II-fold pyridoxal phosphate-dependent enzyme [Herbidospora galbida]
MHLPQPPPPRQEPIGLPVWRSASWASSGDHADVTDADVADNPTVDAFAAAVAALEGAAAPEDVAGQAFSSGMAAITGTLLTFLGNGSHVVALAPVSGATHKLLTGVLSRFGVSADFVDHADLLGVRAAIRPTTKIVYAETLATPTMAVADLRGLYQVARQAGALLVVDSTFATPVVCRPLEHGADLVIHSATRYMGGHDDCVGGVVVGRPDLVAKVRQTRIDTGSALSPDDAFLLRRGLESLPLRVRRMCSTAMVFAASLARHPRVRRVDYPGLPTHPGHQTARHLFDSGPEGTRFGAVVTLTPHGGFAAGAALTDRLRTAAVAPSMGGTHTKAVHLASVARSGDALSGVDAGAVRFAIGLEDAEDLIADVTQALDALGSLPRART